MNGGTLAGLILGVIFLAGLLICLWLINERMKFAQKRRGQLLAEARLEWSGGAAGQPAGDGRGPYGGIELLDHHTNSRIEQLGGAVGHGYGPAAVGRCKVDPYAEYGVAGSQI